MSEKIRIRIGLAVTLLAFIWLWITVKCGCSPDEFCFNTWAFPVVLGLMLKLFRKAVRS